MHNNATGANSALHALDIDQPITHQLSCLPALPVTVALLVLKSGRCLCSMMNN
jgi:hypothetical protein